MENQNQPPDHSHIRGRPPKKSYNPEKMMQELTDAVTEIYCEKLKIKATALELELAPNKVKKLLITAGVLDYPETEQIQSLLQQGKTMEEVKSSLNLSYSTINTYLPYSKVIYKMFEISQNAERVNRYKNLKQAVETLHENCTEKKTCGIASPHFKIIRFILLLACLLPTRSK